MRHVSLLAALATLALAFACGTSSTQEEAPRDVTEAGAEAAPRGPVLRIEPAELSIVLPLNGPSPSTSFKVIAKAEDGTESDVTQSAQIALGDATLASVSPPGTVSGATHGGTSSLTATMQGATAAATLRVKLTGDVLPTGFDPALKAAFDTTPANLSPLDQPSIEYPLDGTILPRNVPPIELQWASGKDSAAYRAHVVAPDVLDVYVYTTTREATVDGPLWAKLMTSAIGTVVSFTVEGLGTRSAPAKVTVARDSIDDSAIYYWESSSGSMRVIDFGASTNAVLPVTGSAYAPGSPAKCVACHTVSRDGTRFSYSSDNFGLGTLKASSDKSTFVASIEPGTQVPQGSKWTYAAFNPSESANVPAIMVTRADVTAAQNTAGHVRLALLDPDTGAELSSNLASWLASFPASMGRDLLEPDWSPAGFVVFASYDSEMANPDGASGLPKAYVRNLGDDAVASSILEAPIAWDGTTRAFTLGAPKVLAPAQVGASLDQSITNVLPQISPDDTLVAFTRSVGWWPIRLQSDTINGSGSISIVRRSDGAILELANASGPADSNSTWPQWAPSAGSDYLWLAFSSERPYGHRMAPSVTLPASCLPQGRALCKNMWVAAIDRKKAASGILDPSAPPFWLPGQTALASAVSPRWAKAAVGAPK